jgi:hypothetical protein
MGRRTTGNAAFAVRLNLYRAFFIGRTVQNARQQIFVVRLILRRTAKNLCRAF